jgi:hypothetical protein
VYNIEVEGENCYRVGESGTLVHNASAGSPPPCGTNPRGWSRVTPEETLYLKNDNNPRNTRTRTLVIVKSVVANLDPSLTGSGTGATGAWLTEPRWMAIDNDVTNTQLITIGIPRSDTVGHIIGKQFGGMATYPAGWSPGNVFPQSPSSQTQYSIFENRLAASIGSCDVCVEIVFTFPARNSAYPYRPDSFDVNWWIGSAQQSSAPFNN